MTIVDSLLLFRRYKPLRIYEPAVELIETADKTFYSNIYIQQDATLHSLFYRETALHVSGGTITHHQERKQLYLQHLVFVTPLLRHCCILLNFSLRIVL